MRSIFLFCTSLLIHKLAISQQQEAQIFQYAAYQTGFLKNVGQVRGLKNEPVSFVHYSAQCNGQQVFITSYGLSILLARPKKVEWIPLRISGGAASLSHPLNDSICNADYELERVDIVLKGASISTNNMIAFSDPSSPIFNVYMDQYSKAGEGLRLQNEVLVKNVYPGIDWKVYFKKEDGQEPSLKYDFIIHPGADPSRIQLRYSNNAHLSEENGEIAAKTHMGVLKEGKPFSYEKENNREVKVSYKLKGNTIKFDVGYYSNEHTLVIDPSIFWMTYLTSTNKTIPFLSIQGNDVETDDAGNIFVQLSASRNTPFPTLNPGGGAYIQNASSNVNGSMIIAKFAPGGQMLWSSYFGQWVGGVAMTRDKFGNIITLGKVLESTPSYPTPNPSIPLLNNGGYYNSSIRKHFIARFTNSGILQWSSYYLGSGSYPIDMSYDINGNVYVVGWSTTWDFPIVNPGGGAYVQNSNGASQVLFISQFDSTTQLTWSTRIPGNDYDPHARVCTDKLGNIYLGGQVRSTNYPLVNAGGYFNTVAWGSVLTRFNSARQMTWSTYFPGAFTFNDLTVDDSSNLYVAADKRILKFDKNTQLIYSKTVNTTQMHWWEKIQFDSVLNQIQVLGVMNDGYYGFPTLNSACNGSFFNNGISPHIYMNATGPIFATINRDGDFLYRSLVDWPGEYYGDDPELTIDINGDPIYIFGNILNGFGYPNPQLTNPGNGAYFDSLCCHSYNGTKASLLLKLTSSEMNLNIQKTPPTGCNCNGTASVTPLCGAAPFTYLWSNGATTSSVNGLCPGIYWVKATDANNLSKTVQILIPYPPGSITSITRTVKQENCNKSNGSIAIQTVQGGTAPYQFSLDGSNFLPSPQFVGLDSGMYVLHVKDVNGCIFKDTISLGRVKGPSGVTYQSVNSSCVANNGQLTITSVTGGASPYQYSLGTVINTSGQFTNLAPGSYMLLISDTAGCQHSEPVQITKAQPPVDASIQTQNDHCNQAVGSILVGDVTGGTPPYAFSVDSASFSPGPITNLTAGNYFLFVRDSNGCVFKKGPVQVENEPGPAEVTFSVEHAYCGRLTGSLSISSVQGGVGPVSYSVDNGSYTNSTVITGILPGSHQLNAKDAFGCVYSKPFQVQYVNMPIFELLPTDSIICYDHSISLMVTGNQSDISNLTWNIPSQGTSASLKVQENKNVSVIIVDKNNCITHDTSTIQVKACNPPEKCIVIPTAFTPNKDGKNESLGPITLGCRVKSIQFSVYNRWGELVFTSNLPGVGWNGIYQGKLQPSGAYIYYCTFVGEDNISRHLKGTFMLLQ